MPSVDSLYHRGDALQDVLNAQPSDTASPRPTDQTDDPPEIHDFSEEEYWSWLASLMDKGEDIDHHLDALLEAIYNCQPPFYSWTGRRKLQDLLNELHAVRQSVRAFEHDVEELTYAFSKTAAVESQAASSAELTLSTIKRTYDRAYDLCLYKLDRMSDGWMTATNLLISITILVVTVLFWMEFWE